jgi:hypothetical protein
MKLASLIVCLWMTTSLQAQTVVTTGTTSGSSSSSGGVRGITFVLQNNNSYDVAISNIDVFRGTASSGTTYTLYYNATSLSGPTHLVNTPGWTVITAITASAVTGSMIHPTFSGLSFNLPANTTYRFAVTQSSGALNLPGSTTPNNTTAGGVLLGVSTYQINSANVGYTGSNGNLSNNGSYALSVTFTPIILAIKLKDISVKNEGKGNVLTWQTASEEKGDKFILLRSTDGHSYTEVSNIPAKGFASEYMYRDVNAPMGLNYYRLKLVDEKGSFTYSKVVTVSIKEGDFIVEAFPNPASDKLNVRVYGTKSTSGTISVSDVSGKIIAVQAVVGGKADVDLGGMSKGNYFLKYQDESNSQTIKVNKL